MVSPRNSYASDAPTIELRSVCRVLDAAFPPLYQESYDNCGLQVGDPSQSVRAALLCIDVTEEVLDEAIVLGCNLIIAHHPLIFRPLRRVTRDTYIERCVCRAIAMGVAIYAAHTSADNALPGINTVLASRLNLTHIRPLVPLEGQLLKLSVYAPRSHRASVEEALWRAGAGKVGAYDCCAFAAEGEGSFRAGVDANPYCGEIGSLHREAEVAISVILPRHLKKTVLQALHTAHPYEEPAYDIIPIENSWQTQGGGVVGDLPEPLSPEAFLAYVCTNLSIERAMHSAVMGDRPIRRVALCGGAGGSFWREAVGAGADALLTGEARYNDYYDVEDRLMLVAAGHFETEHFATELFQSTISREIPNFALHVSKRMCNPVNYYNQQI